MFNKICKRCGKEWLSESRNNRFCGECTYKYKPREHVSKYTMKNLDDDIEAKSYLLGFMYADGYCDEKRNCCYVASTDLQIIEDIRTRIEGTMPIQVYCQKNKKWKDCYKLSFRLQNSEYLRRNGLKNDKADLEIPKDIDIWHFLRGLFDGDGSISTVERSIGVGINTLTFLGQEKLLYEISRVIGGVVRRERSLKNVYVLEFAGHRALDILDRMYKDSTICLKRKQEKYIRINIYKRKLRD